MASREMGGHFSSVCVDPTDKGLIINYGEDEGHKT